MLPGGSFRKRHHLLQNYIASKDTSGPLGFLSERKA